MKRNKITFTIDGLNIEAEEGNTILEAATKNNIYIPKSCYNPHLKPYRACGLFMVEDNEGR